MFNIAPGQRLLISNQRKRFQKGPGIARRAFIPKPAYPGGKLLPDLNAPAGSDLLQHQPRGLITRLKGRQGLPQLALVHRIINLKEVHEAIQGKGFPCGKQGPFHNIF